MNKISFLALAAVVAAGPVFAAGSDNSGTGTGSSGTATMHRLGADLRSALHKAGMATRSVLHKAGNAVHRGGQHDNGSSTS